MKRNKYPNILIISNNSLSDSKNNGKTIASFFKNYPKRKVRQLYFNSEKPSGLKIDSFYQITDKDMLDYFLNRKIEPGRILNVVPKNNTLRKEKSKKDIPINNITRIIRESIWRNYTGLMPKLSKWLDQFSPDIIFFVAGDSLFSYNFVNLITKKYNTKLVTYVTDDYILPRHSVNIFWWIRRNNILKEMKKTVKKSDLFITISQEMRKKYREMFGVDSIILMNTIDTLKMNTEKISSNSDYISLVYAGGLHLKRYDTLSLLGKAIKRYNLKTEGKKLRLKIYSNLTPEDKVLNKINIKDASQYYGSLNSKELKIKLNNCDIPVHVESFDNNAIKATKLSISTKIPEYLSLGKPILAIGPSEISSMKYLKDCAHCVTGVDSLENKLSVLINNKELQKSLSIKAINKFEENHNSSLIREKFTQKMLNL